MRALTAKAVDTLEELLGEEDHPNVRLGAARTVVELGIHQHDAEIIMQKLHEIESYQRQQDTTAHVRRLVADPVTVQCDRLLQTVNPTVATVHQALAAVTSEPPTVAMCPDLYHHPHLVSDITTYRAAAIVAHNFERLVWRMQRTRIDASPELADLKACAAGHGAEVRRAGRSSGRGGSDWRGLTEGEEQEKWPMNPKSGGAAG